MPSVEQIRAHRPGDVIAARALVILAVLLWVPVSGHLYGDNAGFLGLVMVFCVFGSFGAAKGRQAGRIMTTIALLVLCLSQLPYCWQGFRDPHPTAAELALLDIAANLVAVIAVTLLYSPASNRYVQLITVALRGE
ncbi:hypothetical protein [Amycolatopsis samaneae]|uniref:Uncharacterized protein n=1 Tax=Amycolatopsis samaneae TaxID=664691 RepID=A0ABW5GQF1_9PSEU